MPIPELTKNEEIVEAVIYPEHRSKDWDIDRVWFPSEIAKETELNVEEASKAMKGLVEARCLRPVKVKGETGYLIP